MKKSSDIHIDDFYLPLVGYLIDLYKADAGLSWDFSDTVVTIPDDLMDCIKQRPQTIKELSDATEFNVIYFNEEDEQKLGLLGFFNVDFKKTKKVIVVEYGQFGSQLCGNRRLRYGIGARMLLQVTKARWSAKLDTPQHISASVVFNKASAQYSIKTFGITGPGISMFIKNGAMHDDTYLNFVKDISTLLLDVYKSSSSKFIITPQPLFL